MDQYETLFDAQDPGWRVELRLKAGGGPFDPAGYSIMVVAPDGSLKGMEVHRADSQERAIAHLESLAMSALDRLFHILEEETGIEIHSRMDDRRRRRR